jgi:hypothetical protein
LRTADSRPVGEPQGLALFLTALLVCNPIMDIQLNIMTIGLALLAVTAVANDRWNLGALAACLATLLKGYPISLALVLCVLFPRKFAGRWVATLALCLAAPFLFQSSDYVLRQYRDWGMYGLNARFVENYFQDFHRFWNVWFMPISRQTYLVLGALSGAMVAAACLIHARRGASGEELSLTVLCTCTAWMMALGPATEATTYIVLAPASSLVALLCWTGAPQPRWYRAAVYFAFAVLLLAQWQYAIDVDTLGRPIDQLAGRPLAALVLLVAVSVHGVHLGRKAEESVESVKLPVSVDRPLARVA